MRMRQSLKVVGVVALALGMLAACGDGGESKDPDRQGKDLVGAEKLCDGILSKDAVRALQQVTGVTKFQEPAAGDGLSRTAKKLVDEYDQSGVTDQVHDVDLCLIYKPTSSGLSDTEVTFSIAQRKDLDGGKDPSFAKYAVGRQALANSKVAVLYVECASSKMSGSQSSPALLRGELRNRDEPEGDGGKLQKANLTVLNSAGLALSKELGCKGNSGLTESPNLTPLRS